MSIRCRKQCTCVSVGTPDCGAAALAHLAHARAAAATGVGGAPNTAAYTQLATKLESLVNTCLQPHVLPDIAKRVGSSPCICPQQCMSLIIASWNSDNRLMLPILILGHVSNNMCQ